MEDLSEEEQVIPDVKPVAPLQFRMMMRKKHHQIVQLHYGAFMPWATEEVIYSEGIVLFDGDGARTLKLKHQPGKTVSTGHASTLKNLKSSNFCPKEKFWIRFPPERSKVPGFQSAKYCPSVLLHLRELFQLNPITYMTAICGPVILLESSSPGKHGSTRDLKSTSQQPIMVESTTGRESSIALIQQLGHKREEFRKDMEQLCNRQVGHSYLLATTQLHFQS
ncbi:hypothetical protein Nepgr_031215 [Nepenthes gracilis]|uniref:Uncharacterized protein n=1 Tax=Nepenthes gracilis TaxID=150966 RepID=A0AAD3TIE1_NEPGR|nr:hypothetical protein Nepgr_031215 [Nepenthes gracilis]